MPKRIKIVEIYREYLSVVYYRKEIYKTLAKGGARKIS